MNRQEKKRITAIATDVFCQEHNINHPNSTRRERRAAEKALRKRVFRETPPRLFEKHSAQVIKPQVIVPQIRVEAAGVETGKQEKLSPGGIILLND